MAYQQLSISHYLYSGYWYNLVAISQLLYLWEHFSLHISNACAIIPAAALPSTGKCSQLITGEIFSSCTILVPRYPCPTYQSGQHPLDLLGGGWARTKSHFNSWCYVCVSVGPLRTRCQDGIKHARMFLREREKNEGRSQRGLGEPSEPYSKCIWM